MSAPTIAIPARPAMAIPAMAPPPNFFSGVVVSVGYGTIVVPVLVGQFPAEDLLRSVCTVTLGSSIDVASAVAADAVTVETADFVSHTSQVSVPLARTSVAQKAEVEPHLKHACPRVHPDAVKS